MKYGGRRKRDQIKIRNIKEGNIAFLDINLERGKVNGKIKTK